MSPVWKRILGYPVGKIVIFAFILFFLAVFAAGVVGTYMIEIPFRVLCGWAIHGWKALPPFFEKWHAAVLPVGCLLMAFVLAHRFIRRWVEEKRPMLDWRIRHTAAAFSLILLGSAAAIATSGIVHQFFWIAGGKVIESNRRLHLTVARSNGIQLMLALSEFYHQHGRYPRSFDELESDDIVHPEALKQLMWLELGDGNVPEPWILLRPGSSEIALDEEPVIVSPVIPDEGMVVVGYGVSSVRIIRLENLGDVLGKVGAGESEGGR